MTQLTAAPPRPKVDLRSLNAVYPAVVVGVVVIVAWELFVRVGNVQEYLLPAPSAIASTLFQSSSQILSAAGGTTLAVVLGMLLGAATGILAALVVSLFDRFATIVLGLVAVLSCAPVVALAPIFNAWFGTTSLMSKVAVAAIMVFFPVMVNTTRGLLTIDPLHRELGESISMSRAQFMRWVRVPGAVPAMFDGLRIGSTLSVIGIIVAEYFGGAANALGVYIANTAALSQFSRTWAAVVVASLIGLCLYGLIALIERLVAPWRIK
jgi:NitT/TauT family transport system permease protein